MVLAMVVCSRRTQKLLRPFDYPYETPFDPSFTSRRLVISHFSRLFFVYPAIDVSLGLQFCHYLRFDRKSKIIALPSLFPQLMIIFISYRTARLWITFLLNLDVQYPSKGIVPDLILIRITSFLNILHLVIDQPK